MPRFLPFVTSVTARRWILLAAGLLLLGAACVYRLSLPASVPVFQVARRSLVQTLVISGRVMPPVRVNVGSLVAGIVRERLAEDGQRVRAGETLVRLDDAEALAALAQARAAATQAAVRLEQLRTVGAPLAAESLTRARLEYQRADREWQRLRALSDSGLVTATLLDDAEKAVEVARSQVQAASVQQAGSGPAGVEERTARAALEQARAAETAARTRLEQLTIRAPAPGLIIARRVEAGDVVQAAQTLLVLAVDGPALLTIDPDERNLAAIWPGQPALASADAYPGVSFPAAVSFIGSAVDAQRGTVEVRLTVPAPPPTLRADMTVSVELQGGRSELALVVPSECLRDTTSGRPWALVAENGRVERRAVRAGLRGDAATEILAGLAEGELVIPSSAGAPPVGTRVTPRVMGR